jgi:hypothetical protein
MKKICLFNTFYPTMFGKSIMGGVFRKLNLNEAKEFFYYCYEKEYEIVSAIGNRGTAKILSQILDYEVPCVNKMIALSKNDCALIIELTFYPDEKYVYSFEELSQLFKEEKIILYGLIVI